MAVKSRSAVPLFIFLAIALLFLPCAALIFLCLRRRHRRKVDKKSRNEATDAVVENMPNWAAPIELGNIQPPPRAATIRPIRSLQTAKTRRIPTMHRAANETDSPFDNPRTPMLEIAAPKPTKPGRRRSIQVQKIEYLATEQSQNPFEDPVTSPIPPHTARHNLQAALATEQSSVAVGKAGERLATISDAPRVKSQVVKPEHAAAAACYAPEQVPQGWV
ncbi:uncharacterized protein Z520_06269 [Fonsecaea multimorphosa CBS 102226]|uniref:Uncharacterized protein n=1 Tax=Fonsecaea multimorphosa CBS 102226 TaxID=1442371 RepID=A0A0D2K4U1_9EURO|nr:uncharacterized protein Z520_06269 [Fonsecaea multimorphosa CBS 102226]KIX98189.1 hypothetical protein Z520_06269 [Fonsecaea multimorphosa CBS 102226]OAL22672.1 hypothetical protein AYO22_07231 [Fonsecaea multimorphosa]